MLYLSGSHLLTKPLAYKGPTNHLTQFFELPQLYQGMKLLLDELLMDWHYQKDDKQVKGVFLHQGKLIKTLCMWPVKAEFNINHCDCEQFNETSSCAHVAALAIAAKAQLDCLPQPLKQTVLYQSEWHYLTHWLAHQSFDPFPNMARHRVIYILDDQADGQENSEDSEIRVSVHKAYLTQQNEYQKKATLNLDVVKKGKLSKFVSLTDQQIIYQMNTLKFMLPDLSISNNELILFQEGLSQTQLSQCSLTQPPLTQATPKHLPTRLLLKNMVLSGRCFWRSCLRHPLIFSKQTTLDKDCWNIGEQLFLTPTTDQLIDVTPLKNEAVELFLEQAVSSAGLWHPCLKISTEQVDLPWAKQTIEIDIAKISFISNQNSQKTEITLGNLIGHTNNTSTKKNLSVEYQELLEAMAGRVHQLDSLPSVMASFEQPVSQNFEIGTRYISDELERWLPLFRGLSSEGWLVSFENSYRLNLKQVDRWYSSISMALESSKISAESGNNQFRNNWFDLEVGIIVDGHSVNIMPFIIKALKQGLWHFNAQTDPQQPQPLYLTLEDGIRVEVSYKRVKNIVNSLLELYETKPLTDSQKLRLPVSQFSRLFNLQKQTGSELDWQGTEWLKQKAESLSQGKGIIEVTVPDNVKATLRDYQSQGLNWLQFLARESLSGILADDMGLGKTLQTLAHIQVEKNNGRMDGPCMVVAPTSLLGNWFAEASRFAPELNLLYWAGSKRHLSQGLLARADLIITSYGLLLRDAELLNQQNIHLLILDEAQAIKNSRSKVSKLAFSLQSKHRLCLTGTPLENHLGELWSLFHFLMPGFLGDEAQFKRLFRIPIEKEQDHSRQMQLAERIAPFMLRRTKVKVAADLPAKTIFDEFIDLESSQADLYETIRLSMVEEVQKAVANSGAGRNQLLIGNAILRLRQICCAPKLLLKTELLKTDSLKSRPFPFKQVPVTESKTNPQQGELFSVVNSKLDSVTHYTEHEQHEPEQQVKNTPKINESVFSNIENTGSAKLSWLKTTLPEMIENGRKILIFSSFTSMLTIIENLLDELSIDYLSLTGKTTNRTELVSRFQQGLIPVFLISLKAGGAGLNLTQADTVIHFDPWWNPAAENQASDRAHRIGQDKPVFVYKLITKGTVEERIYKMQQQKVQLAEELYKNNEIHPVTEKPDWQTLLAPIYP